MNEVRLGVLGGSLISAIFGYAILRFAPSPAVGTAEDVQTPMVHPTGH
jgi:hypothetical protein